MKLREFRIPRVVSRVIHALLRNSIGRRAKNMKGARYNDTINVRGYFHEILFEWIITRGGNIVYEISERIPRLINDALHNKGNAMIGRKTESPLSPRDFSFFQPCLCKQTQTKRYRVKSYLWADNNRGIIIIATKKYLVIIGKFINFSSRSRLWKIFILIFLFTIIYVFLIKQCLNLI